MPASSKFRRIKHLPKTNNPDEILEQARTYFRDSEFSISFDLYEYLIDNLPQHSINLLSEVYDNYKKIEPKDRYTLYQSRIFDFNIATGAKVLDIGSGHKPFPLATHLADISTTDHNYGRDGIPFKEILGKPVYEFNVENIPFENNEFDFVYCSHVLEHSHNPEKACNELMRIAKRGYIETPTRAKDLWMNSGKASNHIWHLDLNEEKLIFTEYSEQELNGFGNSILMDMHVAPQTQREKAFSALVYLKPEMVNTMLLWEEKFDYEINRHADSKVPFSVVINPKKKKSEQFQNNVKLDSKPKLKFLQVHTFYERYLQQFYSENPQLERQEFDEQIDALIEDGFSGNHIFAPYLNEIGYNAKLVVANNPISQNKWIIENKIKLRNNIDWIKEITKLQIEKFEPDILYLSDPITFDGHFISQLKFRPKLIVGWRAADIPINITFEGFDLFLSGLGGIRETALKLGASKSEYFFPGFPTRILKKIIDVVPKYDLSFVGSWTTAQHEHRNDLLSAIAKYSKETGMVKPAFYLSGEISKIFSEVKPYLHSPRFGIEMYRALKSGNIIFDSRGEIRSLSNGSDLARLETMNMRIFEATGVGGMLLTEHYENLSNLFEIGKEIETFSDEKELIEKIKYYSSHIKERLAIAKRGQERCLRDYSMEARTREFHTLIMNHMKPETEKKSIEIKEKLSDEELINSIVGYINQGEIDKAFQKIIDAKTTGQPIEQLDMLRAFCFINKNDISSAREALLEELSHFPNNQLAKETLNNLPETNTLKIFDDEFEEVVSQIKDYTMLSRERLFSLFSHAKEICLKDIHGNFVECGVARGGSAALIAYVIKKYSKRERKLFAFDSFEGMPTPTEEDVHDGIFADETGWGAGTCSAQIDSLLEIAQKLGVDDLIVPIKGLFQNTLPVKKNEIGEIALLHMDGDWYESTKSILENLYGLVHVGGFIQVDDYGYWEGCKKAIDEFQIKNSLNFQINIIDSTGVWFNKNHIFLEHGSSSKVLVNLGCGNKFHNDWINYDISPSHPSVNKFDLKNGIPLGTESADVVYHSHLLEHLGRTDAKEFLYECYRVLKPNGIIRVAVPDIEAIVRNYLDLLEDSILGNSEAQKRYEWIMLELFDQMVRNQTGGEMLRYWAQDDIPARDFVIQRLGEEAKSAIEMINKNNFRPSELLNKDPLQIGKFRLSGEVHQWMYDRYSLNKLLTQSGFKNIKIVRADESRIRNFNDFLLDINEAGEVRKPDSLFMEAEK